MTTEPRRLGESTVFPIALGCASWSLIDLQAPGSKITPQLENSATQTIHAALDQGVNLFDTARAYTTPTHVGHSEALIARAIGAHPRGNGVLVATKAGHERVGLRFPQDFITDTRPTTIRRHVRLSLELLGTTSIDLLQLHWPERNVPVGSVMETFAGLVDEGLVRMIGLCNASVQQIIDARRVVPLASVQNRFSPADQRDREAVEYCAEEGIAYLAYSPLGGPPTSGHLSLEARFPRASAHARDAGVSIQRLALSWLLAQSPTLIPLCGCSRPTTMIDSARAAELELTASEAGTVGFP